MTDDILTDIYTEVQFISDKGALLVNEMVQHAISRDLKSDQSFVTQVDLAVEQLLRDRVASKFPDHGIVGEEKEDVLPDADFQWIVDPIDGTQNLVHGVPTYGIVIGVFHRGEPIAGAINHPRLNLSYHAARGKGAYLNGERIYITDGGVLPNGKIDFQEIICLSTRAVFERSKESELFDRLVKEHPSHRIFYDIFSTTRAIEGQAAAVFEWNMKVWDFAATQILVEEAGGKFVVARKVTREGSPDMFSLIAGKPAVVDVLMEFASGYKEIRLTAL